MPEDITSTHLSCLHKLAEKAGIEVSYTDVFGDRHEAEGKTLATLLAILGLPADSEASAAASLRLLEDRTWSRQVPGVTVLRDGRPSAISVIVPAPDIAQAVTWLVTLEDGSLVSGVIEAPAQTILDEREDETGVKARFSVALPDDLPQGYHTLSVTSRSGSGQGALIVTPSACWLPEHLTESDRAWGLACQLYSLRSEQNWGMGDFADLATVCRKTGDLGGDLVGINPLHSLFLSRPNDVSPYSPCSRLYLSPLYITVADVPEYATCAKTRTFLNTPEVLARIKATQAADFVDYPAVAALKIEALNHLFTTFEVAASDDRRISFERFVEEGGERLALWAVYQVLSQRYDGAGWRSWPQALHDPRGDAVKAFSSQNGRAVRFFLWLQFEADCQLSNAARALTDAGGRIGLYRDLAVGANPDGADAWTDQDAYVTAARFGAPPDALGPLGQDWGLPPLNPTTLKEHAYSPFIDMLRANMRHAGALRIDHAMALQHLFWILPGLTAADGLYVRYPMDDLLGILALESHRNRCMVIGEDLGTVPDGFRDRMSRENVLSYRILYFERWENGLFMRPDTYPQMALATATSHDLATIPGNWTAWDVALRHHLHLTREGSKESDDMAARAVERAQLHAALLDQKLLPADFPLDDHLDHDQMALLIDACHRFLARSPSFLMMVNMDDLAGETSQVNVPGTVNEYPNWRRRLSRSIEELLEYPGLNTTADALKQERTS